MNRILEFKGTEPKIFPSPNELKILEIIEKQLDILQQLSSSTILVAADTKITDKTPKERI